MLMANLPAAIEIEKTINSSQLARLRDHMQYLLRLYKVGLTLSALQTKPDTCANSVDPDETARNEPSHQDLH